MNKSSIHKLPIITMAIAVLGLAILAILFYIIPGRYRLYQTSLFDQSEEVPLNPMMGFAPDARNLKDCEDTTLVLIDLDWKDWEPEPGFYDKENLEKTYHISDYQKREVCGVLRFHCKAPEDGQKRDLGDAIRALSDYFSDSSFGEKMAVLSDLYSALSKEYGEPTVFYTLKNDSESLLNLQWSFVNEKDEIAKFKNGTYFDDAFIDTLVVFGEKNNFKSNLSDRTRSVISSCIGLPFELLYLVDSDIENFIKHKNGEEMIIPIESKEDSVSFQKKHKR